MPTPAPSGAPAAKGGAAPTAAGSGAGAAAGSGAAAAGGAPAATIGGAAAGGARPGTPPAAPGGAWLATSIMSTRAMLSSLLAMGSYLARALERKRAAASAFFTKALRGA